MDAADFVTLLPGASTTVRLRVTRNGGPRDPTSVSTSTLVATSRLAAASGVVSTATSVLRMIAPDDPIPGAAPAELRVRRLGQDVLLSWGAHLDAVGAHELLELDCPQRGTCVEKPSRRNLDARVARLTTTPDVLSAVLPGAAAPGEPGLSFFKIRGVSPCRQLPGPTCSVDCTDPERCDRTCR